LTPYAGLANRCLQPLGHLSRERRRRAEVRRRAALPTRRRRNLAVAWRPVNRLWRRGFGGRLVGRVADEQSLPHEGLALPEQALAVLVHFCPEAHFVERALQSHMLFGALDEDDVAVAWAADALITQGFPWDLHCLQSSAGNGCESGTTTLSAMRRRGKPNRHVGSPTADFNYRGDGFRMSA
jgi:hypothetical protein